MFGINSYGYGGYGYNSNPLGQLFGFGAAEGVLILVAFIAAIVLTVMGYKRFISDKNELHLSFKDKKSWGPFLRFDILLIDKILKALYIFNALFILFACASVALSSLSFGFGAFLGSLVGMALLCIVLEILLRVGYEFAILNVMIARNTSDIRRKLFSDASSAPATPAPAPTPSPAPVAPVAPAPAPEAPVASAPEPVPTPEPDAFETAPTTVLDRSNQAPADPAPVAPTEVAPKTSFCPNCGAPVEPGDHFCGECGHKLD
ncbi:zinc-ribbon domain-containing protein [Parafannyhessea umbonata]|uniref:Zinc-ribbon domain-containing protein n=1 Tax=Parafannyhessea umbonata TaxID=604330 RepID=A0A1H1MAM3_9ACTN|nr:zinc-ribbon domain-containing protein [Parafannyhessea umbonata]SDR83823.1 zinc-ribbon domain-containing protein [Parafannyhessea umbonata]